MGWRRKSKTKDIANKDGKKILILGYYNEGWDGEEGLNPRIPC